MAAGGAVAVTLPLFGAAPPAVFSLLLMLLRRCFWARALPAIFAVACRLSLQEQKRFGLPAESLLFEWSKRSNQEKTTPLPRPGCTVHPGFPAVLAPCRPLRNSHIHVLEHARFPLQVAPLLGAPQGTPFSFDPASCLVLEASF